MSIGPPKPSQSQLRRRRLKVVEHANAGYNVIQSAKALGVATGTVGNDRYEMRRYITRKPHSRRSPGFLPELEPYDWVTEPAAPAPQPVYRVASPVAAAGALLTRLRNENGVSQTAHAVREAIEQGDGAWYTQSQSTLADLISYLQRMQEIITSADARRKAMTLAGRDDLVTNRRAHAGVKAQDMPAQGDGELPVKTFAELWRYWHAGIPLDSAVMEKIAAGQNSPLARVEEAARQFLALYPQDN